MIRPQEFDDHPIGFAAAMARGLWRGIGKRVHDGDTFTAFTDKGMFDYQMVTIRVVGINAAEIVGTTGAVLARAKAAQQRIEELVINKPILFKTQMSRSGNERMTFERYLADVWFFNQTEFSLSELLLKEGLVDPF